MAMDILFAFYLWIIFVVINFLIGCILLYNTYKLKFKLNKTYLYGFDLTILIHTIVRIFYFIHDFIQPQEELWWNLGALFGAISILPLVFGLETVFLKRTKFALTIACCFGTFLMILDLNFQFEFNLTLFLQIIFAPILFLIITIVYIVVAKNTAGNIRKTAILMVVGFIILEIAQTFHTSASQKFFELSLYLSPILMIIALTILFIVWESFYRKESKNK